MVTKETLLIGSNIRKSKGKLVIVSLLSIIAAILLNIVFILDFDYSKNFYNFADSLNASDIAYVCFDLSGGTVTEDDIADHLRDFEGVSDVEVVSVCGLNGESEFGDGSLINTFNFFSESSYKQKRFDRFDILEDDPDVTEGVYVSYIYKAAQNYKTGDKIAFTFGNKKYEYTIKGFYNNLSTGTLNCADSSCILTDGLYDELRPSLMPMYRIGVKCQDGTDASDMKHDISSEIEQKFPGVHISSTVTLDDTHESRYSNATLFQTILLVSSVLIILILLITIGIVLSDYVKSNIVNLGTLKALGYTSSSLIIPIILEFSLIIAGSSVIGVGGSYAVFLFINKALESQIGIPYFIRFIPQYGLLTVLVTLAMSLVTIYLSIRKITYIEPINAIRVRKSAPKTNNFLSLDKTNFELNTAIGLKTCFGGFSRNVIITVCYFLVSFLIAFSCFLYTNIIMKTDEVIELVCGQVPDVSVEVSKDNIEKLRDALENNSDVLNFYRYNAQKTMLESGSMLMMYLTDDNVNLNKDRILIEGHLAENSQQVAINKNFALNNHLKIGDELICTAGEKNIGFEIVGFTQGASYFGNDGYMLADGYRRIGDLDTIKYYVDLKDDCDFDEWISSFKTDSKVTVSAVTNESKFLDASAKLYKSILVILCIVIVALSFFISCFVLYVLISILLENKRREHGILKSLGFVTRNIIYQVNLSILPFAFISTVIGTVASKKLTDPIISVMLNSLGIFNFGKEITASDALLCIALITVFTIVYTILLSLPIRKIMPHDLFNKE